MSDTTYFAFGTGGAFQNIVAHGLSPFRFKYAVDNHYAGSEFLGIPIRRPADLQVEHRETSTIVIFALSSAVYRSVRRQLEDLGFPPENILYYGDVLVDGLQQRLRGFGVNLRRAHVEFAQRASMIFPLDNHSSSLGPAIFLALAAAAPGHGVLAELGAYKGGHALLANLIATAEGHSRPYYIVDSFEGFPALSAKDPAASAGMFRDNSYAEIAALFAAFPNVTLWRGFIPDILEKLPDQPYATVYYDCDLYEPAVESLRYFFPRLERGGFFLIHDYLPKVGGFDGVKLAVDAFLDRTPGVDRFEVPETTHLILRKN